MTICKLLSHDIKCGLIRKRNLIPFAQFLILFITYYISANNMSILPSTVDYLIYCFAGTEPLLNMARTEFKFPVIWLQILLCPVVMNMDYILDDLQKTGEQILIRCQYRHKWFLSKYISNIFFSIAYFSCAVSAAIVISYLSGNLSFDYNTTLSAFLGVFFQWEATPTKLLIPVIILPLLTIATINILQMTLSLYMKPVYSFLTCLTLLVLAAFYDSSFLLGTGAMLIRSATSQHQNIVQSVQIVIFMVVLLFLLLFAGIMRIKQYDFLDSNHT